MNSALTGPVRRFPAPIDIEITLRGVPLDAALVHYVRESAGKLARIVGPKTRWHVRIQAAEEGARPAYEVGIDVWGSAAKVSLRHGDADEFVAVRDAFELAAQQLVAPPLPMASAS